jgi:hypothetical protein
MSPPTMGADAPTTTLVDGPGSAREHIGQLDKAAVEVAVDSDASRGERGKPGRVDRPNTRGTGARQMKLGPIGPISPGRSGAQRLPVRAAPSGTPEKPSPRSLVATRLHIARHDRRSHPALLTTSRARGPGGPLTIVPDGNAASRDLDGRHDTAGLGMPTITAAIRRDKWNAEALATDSTRVRR